METKTGAEFISPTHVRHVLRYCRALEMLDGVQGLILDAACGTGYGSKILAEDHDVLGVDFSEDAIAEACRERNGVSFMQANLLDAKFGVDAIVSIETIEHFSKDDGIKLLHNFNKWLPSRAPLIISTPYCWKSGPSNITKQHLYEYSLTDFEMTLAMCGFEVETLHIQRHEGQEGRLGYCMAKARKK